MTIKCIWHGHNTLGESPLWDYREQVLYWVDIEEKKLHSLNPQTLQHLSWTLPNRPGCIALNKSGGLVAALEKGFAKIELPTGKTTAIIEPITDKHGQRFNDGKCDNRGRFWAGTADLKEQAPIGALYKLEPSGKAIVMDQGFTVSNGLGWNLDNTIMYFSDSPARKIYQYDFDIKTGSIHNRRLFVKIAEDAGYPDGLTVDSEGYIWSAHWDGWRITRYAPDGTINKVIRMPVQRPTSCCFGGNDLNILFVTSASRDLNKEELTKGPLAGGLFAVATGHSGRQEPLFG